MQKKLDSLRRFNLIMSGLHAIQALIMALIAKFDMAYPITVSYLKFDLASQKLLPATSELTTIPLVAPIIIFLALSSVFHLVIATVGNKAYNKGLRKGLNAYRWVEYSFSASTMMIAIAILTGIYDITALIMIFGLTAIMNLCGLVMEVHNQTTKRTNWLSYWLGCLAGILPWVAVIIYFWAAGNYGPEEAKIPTFVYWIYVSIFAFFNCFAINMVLQYKKVGKWKSYVYGERAYIILSLVAKSALAWQVFAGTLRP